MQENSLAVVIAAGIGSRLRPFTNELPKCMLEVQNKTMLSRALGTFQELGLPQSVVIGGHESEKLLLPDQSLLVLNDQYRTNNILHSLSYAREAVSGAGMVLITYSDIIFQNQVAERLLEADTSDIAIVVDQGWPTRYDGRLLHPLSEAEAAKFDETQNLVEIGKGLLHEQSETRHWGEFIGMMKMNQKGQRLFWDVFDEINSNLSPDDQFQRTAHWRQAYVTDLLQELADRGTNIHCVLIHGGWLEIDTTEDFQTSQVFDFSEGGN